MAPESFGEWVGGWVRASPHELPQGLGGVQDGWVGGRWGEGRVGGGIFCFVLLQCVHQTVDPRTPEAERSNLGYTRCSLRRTPWITKTSLKCCRF